MIRFLISTFLFILLAMVESGFIHGLPEPFLFTPLVFACALYLFQHLNSPVGVWWIFAWGVWLDFWHLGLLPGESLFYAAAGLLAVWLGRNLFTNRSLYGVVGNAFLTLLFIHFGHAVYLAVSLWRGGPSFSWLAFLLFVFWQVFFLLVVVTALFFMANKIRAILKSLLIIPGRESL
jgi:hypothetical protein